MSIDNGKTTKCPKCKELGGLGTVRVSYKETILEAITDPDARIIVNCPCGWRSKEFDTSKEADAEFERHIIRGVIMQNIKKAA